MIKQVIPILALFIIIGGLGCQKPRNNEINKVEKPDLTDYEIVDTIHVYLNPNRAECVRTLDTNLIYEVYTITTETDPSLATKLFHAVDSTGQEDFGKLYLVFKSEYDGSGQIHETYASQFPLYVLGGYSCKFLFEGGGMGSTTIHTYIYQKKGTTQ